MKIIFSYKGKIKYLKDELKKAIDAEKQKNILVIYKKGSY